MSHPIWLVFYCARGDDRSARTTLLRVATSPSSDDDVPPDRLLTTAKRVAGNVNVEETAGGIKEADWILCVSDAIADNKHRIGELDWPRTRGAYFALLAFAFAYLDEEPFGYLPILRRARAWCDRKETGLAKTLERMFPKKSWQEGIQPFVAKADGKFGLDPSRCEGIKILPRDEVSDIRIWALPGRAQPVLSSLAPSLLHELTAFAKKELASRSTIYIRRRKEEEAVLEQVRVGQTWIPIEGEAGAGKTTLLHALMDQLVVDSEKEFRRVPLFLDGSWLVEPISNTPLGELAERISPDAQSAWDLIRKVDAALRLRGARLVVLFDTLDAVLLTGGIGERVKRWLADLNELDLQVISACRPLEADQAKLPKGRNAVRLKDFDDLETHAAIVAYVASYYATSHEDVRHELVRRLRKHAIEQATYGDICRRPVTLRMLFDAYANDVPPEQLSRARLYQDFWRTKLLGEGSLRPRRSLPRQRDRLARHLALAMSRNGERRPLLAGIQLERLLSDPALDLERAAYEELLSEGVLSSSGSGRPASHVSFFHQSFLEYAAARAMLGLPDGECERRIAELVEPLETSGKAPWFALLEELITQGAGTPEGERVLAALLRSKAVGALSVAGSIWCRLPLQIADLHRVDTGRLATEPLAQQACLSHLHDSPSDRIDELLSEFAARAWTSGDQSMRFSVLEAWARTALVYPDQVFEQITHLDIVGYALSELGDHHLSRTAEVLAALLGTKDDQAQELLTRFYDSLLERRGTASRITVVEAVAARGDISRRAAQLLEMWLEAPERHPAKLAQQFRDALAFGLGRTAPSPERKQHERALVLGRNTEIRLRIFAIWRERVSSEAWTLEELPLPVGSLALRPWAELVEVAFIPLLATHNRPVFDYLLGLLSISDPVADDPDAVREIALRGLLAFPGSDEGVREIWNAARIADKQVSALAPQELLLLGRALRILPNARRLIDELHAAGLLLRIIEEVPLGQLSEDSAVLLMAASYVAANDRTRVARHLECVFTNQRPEETFRRSARGWLIEQIKSSASEPRKVALRTLPMTLHGVPADEVQELVGWLCAQWPLRKTDAEAAALGTCLMEIVRTHDAMHTSSLVVRRQAFELLRTQDGAFEASRRTAFMAVAELPASNDDEAVADIELLASALEGGALSGTNDMVGLLLLVHQLAARRRPWAWGIVLRVLRRAALKETGRHGWDSLKDAVRRTLRVVLLDEAVSADACVQVATLHEHAQAAIVECAENLQSRWMFEQMSAVARASGLAQPAQRRLEAWGRRGGGTSVRAPKADAATEETL